MTRAPDLSAERSRILVATEDALTRKVAGPAIRAWHIARALASEHEVVLATTSGRCEISPPNFAARAATTDELADLERWCDVLVVQGFILRNAPPLRSSKKVIIVDIYNPQHLEQLALVSHESDTFREETARYATDVINEQLARGDFFICASTKQRDFWLGQLSALGRVNPKTYDDDQMLNKLVTIVPFGLPDEPPMHTRKLLKDVVPGISGSDEVLLWGGGIYNWFDPLTLIRAVDQLRRRRPSVRLFFMGLRHPNPAVLEPRMAVEARRLAGSLGLIGHHVFFNEDWVPYEDRQNLLLEADLGVSTHLRQLESAFSFRTRILDYIWAGLPIVATNGDSFADLIQREPLGLTVPPGDVSALEEALHRLLEDNAFATTCRENLNGIRPAFAWSKVLQPVVEFCRSPRPAPDRMHTVVVADTAGRGQKRSGSGTNLEVASEDPPPHGVSDVQRGLGSRLTYGVRRLMPYRRSANRRRGTPPHTLP
jgi:glycosyltransferase involved in cell wall biosynthesis